MKKILLIGLVFAIVGCQSITKPWKEKTPGEKAVTVGVGLLVVGGVASAAGGGSSGKGGGGSWEVDKHYVLPKGPVAVAANFAPNGEPVISTSHVFNGGHRSYLYRGQQLIGTFPGCETLADPIDHAGHLDYSSEHCNSTSTNGNSVSRLPVGGKNQWSIATGKINGQPVGFFNTDYKGRSQGFVDGSVARNLHTGQIVWRIKGRGFVRDFAAGCATIGWNQGNENIQCLDGRQWRSTALTATQAGSKHLVAGDVRWGQGGPGSPHIRQVKGTSESRIATMTSKNVMQLNSDGGNWIACGVNPSTVMINGRQIWPTASTARAGHSFHIACDIRSRNAIAAVTVGGVVHVYEFKKK